jgi:hypothetical protein
MPVASLRPLITAIACVVAVTSGCDCAGERLAEFTPELRLAPAEVDFGEVSLGATGAASLRLFNDGSGPIELDGPVTVDDGAFGVGALDIFPVPARDFRALDLTFTPTEEGAFSGTLTLPLRAPIGEVTVPIRGVGAPNPVRFDPVEVDFGALDVGELATATATVFNDGEAPINVNLVIDGRGFGVDGTTLLPVALEPGGQRALSLSFSPPRGGEVLGRLIAQVCGPGCGPEIALSGVGLAPRIDVQPRPLDFGDVPLGETREAEITIINTGVGALTISDAVVPGGDPRLELELPATPFNVEPEGSITGTLRYRADEPEAQLSASVRFTSNDPLSPEVAIPVTAPTPGAALRVIPGALSYGSLPEGDSRSLDIVIRASGTEPVTITDIELQGEEAASAFTLDDPFPSLPTTLPGGGSLLVSVRGTATAEAVAAGIARAVAVVTAQDGDENPLTGQVDLELGTGAGACDPVVVIPNVNLGFVQIGQGARGSVFVENRGTSSCITTRVSPAEGLPFDPGFTFRAQTATSLLPGETGEVVFAFQASSGGARSAVLSLEYEAAEGPLLVSATAYGVLGSLAPVPALLELGPTAQGCEVTARVMSFANTGGAPVEVVGITIGPDNGPFTLTGGDASIVDPGRSTFVTLDGDATNLGLFQRQVVAETVEIGLVTGTVQLEVVDPLTPITEEFIAPSATAADVLFIVDNSGSMGDDQVRLAQNFERFIDIAANEGDVDFHIALTSTDIFNGGAEGELLGTPRVLSQSTTSIEQRFAERAELGVVGSPVEMGFEAMRLATSEPLRSGVNRGFLRDNAILSVIVVSDEDDSGPQSSDQGHHLPPDAYAGHLEGLKGAQLDHAPVIFSLVGPPIAPRYQELVSHFGGVHLDITSPDWGERLGDLGEVTFASVRTFRLSNPPLDGTITVTVDGVPTTDFTVTGRSVQLNDPPDPNTQVSVSYTPDC